MTTPNDGTTVVPETVEAATTVVDPAPVDTTPSVVTSCVGKIDPVVAPVVSGTAAVDPVTLKLQGLGVSDDVIAKIKSDLGAESVDDLDGLTENDLVSCGMKALPARNFLKKLQPQVAGPAIPGVVTPKIAMVSNARLEEPPQAESWLKALSAIRPQVIAPTTVITGIKACMADSLDYFDIPGRMAKMLLQASEDSGEVAPPLYTELISIGKSRRYGDIVSWMKGQGGSCTLADRERFLEKMRNQFWNALDSFYSELEAWRIGKKESTDLGEVFMSAMQGETQIHDATAVRNAALAFGDKINYIFSGTGIFASTALALDREKIEKVIINIDYRLFGVQSREKLLQDLKCMAPPEIESAEITVGKFVWNLMMVSRQAAGSVDEQKFLTDLAVLGASRPWRMIQDLEKKKVPNKKSTGKISGIGSGRRNDFDSDFDLDED